MKGFSSLVSRSLVIVGLLLTGCSVTEVEYPDEIKEIYPVNTPKRNITGFTAGLQCMDELFARYKVRPIRITAAQIPDFSESRGDAGFGAREMLISALSAMSQKSGALRFVAYDRSTPDIIALQSAHPRKADFAVPDFFIRGAVTQIQSSPYSKQRGFSGSMDQEQDIELNSTQLSHSNSKSLKSVSADLNMGLINTFEILPGISSSNSFSVEKSGSSDDYSLSVWKLGTVYSVNDSRAEALSTGLRALMEVGVMELFGKLYNLPYWECLAVLGKDTDVEAKARDTYEDLDDEERMSWVAKHLRVAGLLSEKSKVFSQEGHISDPLRQAIAQYQVKNGMLGNGHPDFALFASLYKEKHIRDLADRERPSDMVGKLAVEDPADPEPVKMTPTKAAPKKAPRKAVKQTEKKAAVKK